MINTFYSVNDIGVISKMSNRYFGFVVLFAFLLSVLPYCQLLVRLLLSLRCIKLCSLSFSVLMDMFFVFISFVMYGLAFTPECSSVFAQSCCFVLLCHLVFHSQWAVFGLLFHFALHLCLLLNDICPFYANKRLFLIFT